MLHLAIKHLLGRIKVTLMTFLGIFAGTVAFVVISGFFVGFQNYMTSSLVNGDAHIKISAREERLDGIYYKEAFFPKETLLVDWIRKPFGDKLASEIANPQGWFEKLSNDPRIVAFTPVLSTSVLINQKTLSYSVKLTGIRPEDYIRVTNIEEKMQEGDFLQLGKGLGRIVITKEFAEKVGVALGDVISVTAPSGDKFPLKIVGLYSTGNAMSDRGSAIVNIKDAGRIASQMGHINQIFIRTKDYQKAAGIANELKLYSSDKVESWDQANKNFLGIFQTQNMMRYSVSFVILLIAAFGIFNILNMTIQQKRKDIAILRSMGFESHEVSAVFLYQGIILGILGSILGCFAGYFICNYLSTLTMTQPTGRTKINISFEAGIYIQALCLGNLAAIVASYLPARLASKLLPMEIIRQGAE